MSEAEVTEIVQKIAEWAKPIWDAIVDIANKVIEAVKEMFRDLVISIIKQQNDKKAYKYLHIYLHTKNRRMKKKQMRRMTNIVLNYIYT